MSKMFSLLPILVFGFARALWSLSADSIETAEGALRITPIRHASFMLEFKDKVIHVDPWSQGNYQGLPKADLILITDTHPDHLDLGKIMELSKPGTKILAPPAAVGSLTDAIAIANGETRVVEGINVEALPMYNLIRGPGPGKLYHEKGRGNGYVLTLGGKRLYISGDTECIPETKGLKDIDVAFVCMNLPYTMPPEEAAQCVRAFHPKIVYPYHYGKSDLNIFVTALKNDPGIEVRLRTWY
jgi:L-ascorbate metabolism protein UlaG (beta-lactamase superfamily)